MCVVAVYHGFDPAGAISGSDTPLQASGRRVKKMEPTDRMMLDLHEPEGIRMQIGAPW